MRVTPPAPSVRHEPSVHTAPVRSSRPTSVVRLARARARFRPTPSRRCRSAAAPRSPERGSTHRRSAACCPPASARGSASIRPWPSRRQTSHRAPHHPSRRRRSRPTTGNLGGSWGRDPDRRPRGRRASPPALGPRRPDRGRVPPSSLEAPRPRDRGSGTIVARSGRHRAAPCRAAAVARTNASPPAAALAETRSIGSLPGLSSSPPTSASGPSTPTTLIFVVEAERRNRRRPARSERPCGAASSWVERWDD